VFGPFLRPVVPAAVPVKPAVPRKPVFVPYQPPAMPAIPPTKVAVPRKPIFVPDRSPSVPAKAVDPPKSWVYDCTACHRRYRAYRASAENHFCGAVCKQRFYRRHRRLDKRKQSWKLYGIAGLAIGAVVFFLRTMSRTVRQ